MTRKNAIQILQGILPTSRVASNTYGVYQVYEIADYKSSFIDDGIFSVYNEAQISSINVDSKDIWKNFKISTYAYDTEDFSSSKTKIQPIVVVNSCMDLPAIGCNRRLHFEKVVGDNGLPELMGLSYEIEYFLKSCTDTITGGLNNFRSDRDAHRVLTVSGSKKSNPPLSLIFRRDQVGTDPIVKTKLRAKVRGVTKSVEVCFDQQNIMKQVYVNPYYVRKDVIEILKLQMKVLHNFYSQFSSIISMFED